MIRVLVLISITGFFVALVALSSAVALGGPELAARNWRWTSDWWFDHDHGVHRSSPTATRELAWDGASELDVGIRAEVEYLQGEGPGTVTISGPLRLVSQVKLDNGRLSYEDETRSRRRLTVRIVAPGVTRFQVNGDDRLDIRDYDQPELEIAASGASEVTARGRAGNVRLILSGDGEADLGQLEAEAVDARISGDAEARLAPKASADLRVSGSGEATLLTRPGRLNVETSGAGRVRTEESSTAADGDSI
ncbi:MAG: GIN domain-containing protein [Phenylobacterium sp.]|uniref:GIN domain-containing protein n=1 Tax=Phenylobacterium sp. TaxID=1871053 RepID=UPI00391AE18B